MGNYKDVKRILSAKTGNKDKNRIVHNGDVTVHCNWTS
jgi:hypothetical protein